MWLLVAIGNSMEQVAGGESWSVFMIMSAAQPDQSYPASKSDLHHDGDDDDDDDDEDDDGDDDDGDNDDNVGRAERSKLPRLLLDWES